MTGTELSAALAEKLKALLPDCAVRPAFTGTLQRLPQPCRGDGGRDAGGKRGRGV